MTKETYLGDGLYASFDGWQIRLYTTRDDSVHEVYLEWDVFNRFVKFAEDNFQQKVVSA